MEAGEQDGWTLLDAHEVARRLNVSKARVYDLTRRELFPAVHLGRQLRYRLSDIEAWIRRGGAQLPGGWREKAS